MARCPRYRLRYNCAHKCGAVKTFIILIMVQSFVMFFMLLARISPNPHHVNEIIKLKLPDVTYSRKSMSWLSSPDIPRVTTREEHEQFMKLLKITDELFNQFNITYFLDYGALLGSYFMHDLLPWDDDVDLVVKIADEKKLLRMFESDIFSTKHNLGYISRQRTFDSHNLWKIFDKNSTRAGIHNWGWPFLDITCYAENSSHVWNYNFQHPIMFPRERVYPLHHRPLGSIWLPAPRDPPSFFGARYGHVICTAYTYSHRWELPRLSSYEVPCEKLKEYYPFVTREKAADNMVMETLTFNGSQLYTVLLPAPLNDTFQQVMFSDNEDPV